MLASLRERYFDRGYLLVEGVFDSDALEAARRSVAGVPEWVRQRSNDRNVQRAQPLQTCPAIEDKAWIRRFYDNPALDRVLEEVFGDVIAPVPRMSRDFQSSALLIDPLDTWWATGLHRDYRDFLGHFDVAGWRARFADFRLFNQINIPLLPDSSLWLVPGSHMRDDSEREAQTVRERGRYAGRRTGRAAREDEAENRRRLAAGLRDVGAVNVAVQPGDILFYRSNMLHCGIYEPGTARLTVHDAVYSEAWRRYVIESLGLRPGAAAGRG